MWMSSDGLARIGATVQRGGTAEVDRLLSDVFLQPSPRSQAPLTCPACRHDLVRQPLAAADLFVSACPQGHGAWLDPDIAESLRCLVATRAAVASRHRLLALGALAASSLALLVALSTRRDPPPPPPPLVSAPAAGELTRDGVDLGRLGDDYWPERRWPGARAIPLKESHIDRYAELVYFRDLLALLDAGITNRLNIEGALAVRRT
ncbi:MAG TPA: hypothetical protein VFL90_16335, partial [Methylomirabilota bacterium]|nr:hypothetical protein [Methylomirabilota bacterium]